jgi:hypothetical protein
VFGIDYCLRQRLRATFCFARAALRVAAEGQIGAAQIGKRTGNGGKVIEICRGVGRRSNQFRRVGMPWLRE